MVGAALTRGDSQTVALIRDGLLAGVGLLMCWAIYQLHDLSNRVTAIESSRYSVSDGANAERRVNDQLGVLRREFVESTQQIQRDISTIRDDLSTIKGALGEAHRWGEK